jgi:hypothetical protein
MDAEAVKRFLEDGGLRCTPQRYAVMAFLLKQNRHPTAAEIFQAVNRVDPRSSRATTRETGSSRIRTHFSGSVYQMRAAACANEKNTTGWSLVIIRF